jgi:hypothetical protein
MKANKVAIIDIYVDGIFIRKLESVWSNLPNLELKCSFEITTQKLECKTQIDKQLFDFIENEVIKFLTI